ncbi:MAG: DUF6659 family protein [Nitrosopumilus sp.]
MAITTVATTTTNFDILHDEIMDMDRSVRYSVVLNKAGERVCGGYRKKGITPLLNDEELKMVHFYAGQRWSTRKNIEHRIGKTRYAMAEYDRLKRMTFPIDENHLLTVTTETDADHQKIIAAVLNLIKRHFSD